MIFNSIGHLHLGTWTLIEYVHLHSSIPCFLTLLIMDKHALPLV